MPGNGVTGRAARSARNGAVVIGKISKGNKVAGLLYYLFGPGKSDEHTDPHLVAGWREPSWIEPPVTARGKRDFRDLVNQLNAPLDAADRRGRNSTVWHCALAAAPEDPLLSDAQWHEIAAEFMDRMGLASREDWDAVRWIAVRHGLSSGGIDHVHIVATLARQDGGLPSVHNDYLRARRACRAIEKQHGLRATAPADRTAARQPTRAETEQAARHGLAEPPRLTLRRIVADAAATAAGEDDFFARVRDAGALTRVRNSTERPGEITGYAVALPAEKAGTSQTVWFSGGKLAPDLTLPKLRRRWDPGTQARPVPVPVLPEERHAAWAKVIRLTGHGAVELRRLTPVDPAAAADAAWATADALRASARVIGGTSGREIRRAADTFDRAAREAYRVTPRPTPAGNGLRTAARLLSALGTATGPGIRVGDLIANLIALAEETARLRLARMQLHQATAATSAARQLAIVCREGSRVRAPARETATVTRRRTKTAAGLAAMDLAGPARPQSPGRTPPQPLATPAPLPAARPRKASGPSP